MQTQLDECKRRVAYFSLKKDVRDKMDLEYDPGYGDSKVCECGHTYHRHFDSYDDMKHVGCKYCCCYYFKERE